MKTLVFILGLSLAACSTEEAKPTAAGPGKMRIAPAATVMPHEIKSQPFEVKRDYGGEFVSDAQADLSAEVSGVVREVNVRLGDRVEKDQVLAIVDPVVYQQRVKELQASVSLSQASVEEARAQLQNLQSELNRKKPLLARQLVTAREIEDLESQIAVASQRISVAQATVDQNRARLATGRDNLQDTRVRAPFAGVVAERFVDMGNHVNAGQALFRIVDNGDVYLQLRVAEHDSGMIEQGMKVTMRIDALGGELVEGTVARIAPAVDPQTRTLRIDVVKGNDDNWNRIKPGMYARAQIVIAARASAVVAPSQAIQKDRDGSRYVWKIVDGKAFKTSVQPGVRDRDQTEILDGLKPGDLIVLRGEDKVTEGGVVQLVTAETPGTKETP
ncbi:MAG: efflux RND transporter periplasmic adaptor subunit [bacterium]